MADSLLDAFDSIQNRKNAVAKANEQAEREREAAQEQRIAFLRQRAADIQDLVSKIGKITGFEALTTDPSPERSFGNTITNTHETIERSAARAKEASQKSGLCIKLLRPSDYERPEDIPPQISLTINDSEIDVEYRCSLGNELSANEYDRPYEHRGIDNDTALQYIAQWVAEVTPPEKKQDVRSAIEAFQLERAQRPGTSPA